MKDNKIVSIHFSSAGRWVEFTYENGDIVDRSFVSEMEAQERAFVQMVNPELYQTMVDREHKIYADELAS